MSQDFLIGFWREAFEVALMLSLPMLGVGLLVGVLVSIFQAVTSIQEMTLTFIPKIVAVGVAIVAFFPWMMQLMVDFTTNLLTNIPTYIQ
ncbi:MAG: flagellar biosynthesis protein FliQ [Nitrospinae bacterium]|nr:flagellar biosynthesis protein FliQ [Nitrospinota bacterium]